jgi:hypothetical protein
MFEHCRVCGCSNLSACAGGCWWVEDDLCSSCVPMSDDEAFGTDTTPEIERELDGL